MKKYTAYIVIASVCAALGLFLRFALMGYSFMAYGLFGAAAVTLSYMALRIAGKKYPKPVKIINRIITYGLVLFLVLLAVTEGCLINESRSRGGEDAEYAIVLGAGVNGTTPSRSLLARLEAALDYAEENPEAKFILSGGQGPGEDITEAECMYRWLTARGVDEERLILEERASSTVENIKFSRELILEEDPGFDGTVCIITEGYHMLRAKLMALDNGFEHVSSRSGSTGMPILTINYYFREAFGFWYYMITR